MEIDISPRVPIRGISIREIMEVDVSPRVCVEVYIYPTVSCSIY